MNSYYAEVDKDNIVVRVILSDDPVWPVSWLGGKWVETSNPYVQVGDVAYTGPGRGYDRDWPVSFAPRWVQPVASTDEGWTWYNRGEVVFHNGRLWVSTMNENVWEPGVSGWRRTPTKPGRPPAWTPPTGAHDPWQAGEYVRYRGVEYVSLVDNNVWQPGTDDTLWREIVDGPVEPEQPVINAWVQPEGAHDAYGAEAKVSHAGQVWINTHGDGNVWEPGVFGWVVE